jgi:hypothetical protein
VAGIFEKVVIVPSALVINPWVVDFKLYDEWMHPVGLYFLISLLRHLGWEVAFHDCLSAGGRRKPKNDGTAGFEYREYPRPPLYRSIPRRYKLYGESAGSFDRYLRSVREPDCIFIGSGMTYWFPGLLETVRSVRSVFPSRPVVAGGVSARLIPGYLRGALGENVTVYEGALGGAGRLDSYTGGPAAPASTAPRAASLVEGLRCLDRMHHGPVLTSLGCPLRCSYCASAFLGGAFSERPVDTVLNEIAFMASAFGVDRFAFYDDALMYRAERRLVPLLSALIEKKLNARFFLPNGLHLAWLTPEVLSLMKRAGVETLRFGYETGAPCRRAHTSSKTSRKIIARAARMLDTSGYGPGKAGVYLMAGFPGQTPADMLNEMEFLHSLGFTIKPVFLSPVPHTGLFGHYLRDFPALASDPLMHNDTYFITRLPGWTWDTVQRTIGRAKEMNRALL